MPRPLSFHDQWQRKERDQKWRESRTVWVWWPEWRKGKQVVTWKAGSLWQVRKHKAQVLFPIRVFCWVDIGYVHFRKPKGIPSSRNLTGAWRQGEKR